MTSISLLQKTSVAKQASSPLQPNSFGSLDGGAKGEAPPPPSAGPESSHINKPLSRKSSNGSDLIFIHIPKTGGTAIEEAGTAYGLPWGWLWKPKMNMGDGWENQCNKRHVPPSLHPEDYSTGETFCIVREPYSRIISEYRYLIGQDWAEGYGIESHDGSHQSCANGLNSFVQSTLREYERLHFLHDCHVIPQSEYIWSSNGHRWCEHIFRFETLSVSFNSWMKTRGLPIRLTSHANVAEKCPNLSSSDLTADTLGLIRSVYADDFEKLNYSSITNTAVLQEYWFDVA